MGNPPGNAAIWEKMKGLWMAVVNADKILDMNRGWHRFQTEYDEFGYTRQYGIPCWHRLVETVQQDTVIELYLFDMHWRFVKSPLPVDEEGLRRILDPAVIPRRHPVGRRHDERPLT